jgi:hypothetical protein
MEYFSIIQLQLREEAVVLAGTAVGCSMGATTFEVVSFCYNESAAGLAGTAFGSSMEATRLEDRASYEAAVVAPVSPSTVSTNCS